MRSISPPRTLVLGEALAGARRHELLGAGACGHAGRGDPHHVARAPLQREGAAVEGVDLLGGDPGDGGGLVLGVARLDRHLGARGPLAFAHKLGNVRARVSARKGDS